MARARIGDGILRPSVYLLSSCGAAGLRRGLLASCWYRPFCRALLPKLPGRGRRSGLGRFPVSPLKVRHRRPYTRMALCERGLRWVARMAFSVLIVAHLRGLRNGVVEVPAMGAQVVVSNVRSTKRWFDPGVGPSARDAASVSSLRRAGVFAKPSSHPCMARSAVTSEREPISSRRDYNRRVLAISSAITDRIVPHRSRSEAFALGALTFWNTLDG